MKMKFNLLSFLLLPLCAVSCQSRTSNPSDTFTLAVVQKKIQTGMTQAEVVESLGMPNIITKDAKGKEVWVYDKMASEIHQSNSQAGIWIILAGAGSQSSHTTTKKKTLTVLIKFTDENRVDSLSYHSSQF